MVMIFKVKHSSIGGERAAEAKTPRQAKFIVFRKHVINGSHFTPKEVNSMWKKFVKKAKAVRA